MAKKSNKDSKERDLAKAKSGDENSRKGRSGEYLVASRMEEMRIDVSPTSGNFPLIDGHMEIYDEELHKNWTIKYQVKTGCKFFEMIKNNNNYIRIVNLEKKHIDKWLISAIPVIIIGVYYDIDNPSASPCMLWENADYAETIGIKGKIKVSTKKKFDKTAIKQLIDLAKERTGKSPIRAVKSNPLLSQKKVSEIKKAAWNFFSNWREVGSISKIFGKVDITKKFWRHITRNSLSQDAIIYRLNMLPLAKDTLENSRKKEFLRIISKPGIPIRKLYALSGIHETTYRPTMFIKVIVEETIINGEKKFKLYSFYEKK
jgi:hypothetical protein